MRRYGFSALFPANCVANKGDHTHVMVHQEMYLHFLFVSVKTAVVVVKNYQT